MQSVHGGVRRAFTLVELLVVIGIITLLAAILVPAAYMAIQSAKNGRMALEVAGLSKALERYKMEYGEYPPDFSHGGSMGADELRTAKRNLITNHLSRIFRRRNARLLSAGETPMPGTDHLTDQDIDALNPTTAPYFWLRGFSPDPQLPLTGAGAREPFLDFDKGRLVYSSPSLAVAQYYPSGAAKQTPFIYYRADSYPTVVPSGGIRPAVEWAVANSTVANPLSPPYLSIVTSQFAESEKFQLLCAGLDGEYGAIAPGDKDDLTKFPVFPNGLNYKRPDRDNITSFSGGKTLENAKP